MTTYIIRNGQIEHVWEIKALVNGFHTYTYCRGTENEVRAYMEGEFPLKRYWMVAMTDTEVEMLDKLHITIYIAPKQ